MQPDAGRPGGRGGVGPILGGLRAWHRSGSGHIGIRVWIEGYKSMSINREWVRVASVRAMREGEGYDTGQEVNGDVVGLFLFEGRYYAVGECTHERGPICQGHREGLQVSCPWHSALFNIATGECLQGPGACRTDGSVHVGALQEVDKADPLAVFDVKVEGDDILVRPKDSEHAVLRAAGNGRAE